MYVVDEGKNKVFEIGVYILETLGSVGLPAEQVKALLQLRATEEEQKGADSDDGHEHKAVAAKKLKNRRRRKKKAKSRAKKIQHEDTMLRKACERRRGSSSGRSNPLFQRAMRFVIEARNSSPQQIISRILFYLADALGESLDNPSKRDLERAVDAFVEEAHTNQGRSVKLGHIPQSLSRAVTGVVLQYQERDDVQISSSTMQRIRRGMHFNVPVKPFEATVQLVSSPQEYLEDYRPEGLRTRRSSYSQAMAKFKETQEYDDDDMDEDERDWLARALAAKRAASNNSNNGRTLSEVMMPCTPQSFPPTPESRTALLEDYSEFTENVLWRARDELRGAQEADERPRMAIFNPDDAHPKIMLSCGGHCAALDHRSFLPSKVTEDPPEEGSEQEPGEAAGCESFPKTAPSTTTVTAALVRIYRSVRAALSVFRNKTTYLEFCPVWSGTDELDIRQTPLQLCVGLASKRMALRNTVPGCAEGSVGLDSSGVLLLSKGKARAPKFTYGSVIGLCIRPSGDSVHVGYFIDGHQVFCYAADLGLSQRLDPCEFEQDEKRVGLFPINTDADGTDLYPTISIKSAHVKIFAHFTTADLRHNHMDAPYWSEVRNAFPGDNIYALDGTKVRDKVQQSSQSPAESSSPKETKI